MADNTLVIDGSYGEGGGQILRTALSLSCITGIPIKIFNIRKNRKKPGLMPQHLTCVKIMKMLFSADTEGDDLYSQNLYFKPNEFCGKDFFYDIGTAGSTSLVFQTILPCIAFFKSPIKVTLRGGTNVPMSPTFDYLKEVFSWHLEKIGIFVDFQIEQYGFYPKGCGVVNMRLKNVSDVKNKYDFTKRGELFKIFVKSCTANLPLGIAERQKDAFLKKISSITCPIDIQVMNVPSIGKGTYIFVKAVYDNTVAGFSALGEIGKPAETVGEEAGMAFIDFEKDGGFYDEHMGDQILIYLSLFTKTALITVQKETKHFKTNLWVISKFFENLKVIRDNKTILLQLN